MKLGNVVSAEPIHFSQSGGVPVRIEIHQRCERALLKPATLDCCVRLAQDRTSGYYNIASCYCMFWVSYDLNIQSHFGTYIQSILRGTIVIRVICEYPL